MATCTSQQLQDCKFTVVVFNVLVLEKYGHKTAFQEPCVLQTKFVFFGGCRSEPQQFQRSKTEPCISIAMGAMSKEGPPKKRCSELCGSVCFVFVFRVCVSAGAAKIYEHVILCVAGVARIYVKCCVLVGVASVAKICVKNMSVGPRAWQVWQEQCLCGRSGDKAWRLCECTCGRCGDNNMSVCKCKYAN